jgi:hypothetical protein
MAFQLMEAAAGEHKKRKRRNAKSTSQSKLFLCAFCVGFVLFVFPRL